MFKRIITVTAVCSFIMFSGVAAAEAKAPSDLLDAQPTTALVKEHAEVKKSEVPAPLFERTQELRIKTTKRTTTIRRLSAESLEFSTTTSITGVKIAEIETKPSKKTVEKSDKNKGRIAARKLVTLIDRSGLLSDTQATTPEVAAAE